jgi:hypothetical protein
VDQLTTTNEFWSLVRLIPVLGKPMTQKEHGDFDAVILSISARLSGIDLSAPIQEWIAQRLRDGAFKASIRVASRIGKASQG